MKKIFLPILFILVTFIISGCSFEKSDESSKTTTNNIQLETNEENDEQKQLAQKEEIFNKNLECNQEIESLEKRIKDFNSNHPDWQVTFEEIFYSPKTNSCLYIQSVDQGIYSRGSTLKKLMDLSYNVGGNPINDISCEEIWNYNLHFEGSVFSETEKESIVKMRERECLEYEKGIEIYKSL